MSIWRISLITDTDSLQTVAANPSIGLNGPLMIISLDNRVVCVMILWGIWGVQDSNR
jgi:hypothetical protein